MGSPWHKTKSLTTYPDPWRHQVLREGDSGQVSFEWAGGGGWQRQARPLRPSDQEDSRRGEAG